MHREHPRPACRPAAGHLGAVALCHFAAQTVLTGFVRTNGMGSVTGATDYWQRAREQLRYCLPHAGSMQFISSDLVEEATRRRAFRRLPRALAYGRRRGPTAMTPILFGFGGAATAKELPDPFCYPICYRTRPYGTGLERIRHHLELRIRKQFSRIAHQTAPTRAALSDQEDRGDHEVPASCSNSASGCSEPAGTIKRLPLC
jgi:hypothetical protein